MSTANSTVNQVLEAVIGLMNAAHPFARVTRGALPTGNGLTCEIGPTSVSTLYMDKNTVVPLYVTLNGKHANLMTLSDSLNAIHSVLTRAQVYPAANNWQIIDILNRNLPSIIGRESNNEWLMASALTVKFYWRGE